MEGRKEIASRSLCAIVLLVSSLVSSSAPAQNSQSSVCQLEAAVGQNASP